MKFLAAALSLVFLLGLTLSATRNALPPADRLFDDPPPSEETAQPPESAPAQEASADVLIYLPLISTPTPTAFHRSGQTFLTWPEQTNLQGELYRIYRSNQPISMETLPQAKLVGEVGKGSANFYTNRYHDLSTGTWRARYVDRLVVENGGPQIRADWGLFVWTVSQDDLGNAASDVGYYAITVNTPGGDETFSSGMTVGPVYETVSDPLPVEITPAVRIGDGGHVYIQYMDLHDWNPTFHAPNPSNSFYGLDPGDINLSHSLQYAYDYTVFTPPAKVCGGSLPGKLPVFFHLHGWREHTTSPEDGYPGQD